MVLGQLEICTLCRFRAITHEPSRHRSVNFIYAVTDEKNVVKFDIDDFHFCLSGFIAPDHLNLDNI